jgi:hypothetical protein
MDSQAEKFTKNARGLIMTTSHATAGFALKVGYFVLAAVTLVFVAMLVLTVLHP